MTVETAPNESIPVWIPSEWNQLQSAVMRMSIAEKDRLHGSFIEEISGPEIRDAVMKILEPHTPQSRDNADELADTLEKHGVKLHYSMDTVGFRNQVFVRDVLFGIRHRLFLVAARKFSDRQADLQEVEHIYKHVSDVVQLSYGALDGGDVLVLSEDRVLLGSQGKGAAELSAYLQEMNIETVSVPRTKVPHLDCAIAPLPPKKAGAPDLLVRPDALKKPQQTIESLRQHFHEIIECSDDCLESLNLNILWLNPETVISTTSAQCTNQTLRERGYEVIAIPYDDILKCQGGIHCSVAPLERSM